VKEQINKLKRKANIYTEMKKQRGMSLLEVIIVLGIIGTIAAGVVILAQRAFSSQDITNLVSNTNSVRLSAQEAYKDSAYPTPVATATKNMTPTSIKETANSAVMSAGLVQLGKISESEVKNGISGDYFYMGGSKISAGDSAGLKGFFVALNGLDQGQCRNIITQIGNQWDYVEVSTAAAGADPAAPGTLDTAVAGNILRSLHQDGAVTISPTAILSVCANTGTNAVILGSR
jgi:toxin co-regulated pilin